MKCRIRYADQLVGLLTIIALLSLIFVIFMLGRTQKWFSKTFSYKTYAAGASGLSRNMAVSCRGIPIGNVKSFRLTDDNRVEVVFDIHEEFQDRAKIGSLVEIAESPIGLGARFIFYPGIGGPLEEGDLVPMRDSPEGRDYIDRGLAYIPFQEDAITNLLGMVGSVLSEVQGVIGGLQVTIDGLNVAPDGRADTALGQTVANIQTLTANLASDLANPNGIRKILNGDGDTIDALEASIVSLSQTLEHIEKTAAILPRELPAILIRVGTTLQAVNDVLISLRNNPLLRNGIPEHAEIDSSGTNPRNIRF
jgi:phospholipid/cholesterol/gamma-HCH transport system substrate-binding protein